MRRRRKGNLKPDLTSLIDVVFLLIIFFMISTTFNNYGSIPIELPSSTIESKKEEKNLEIIIDKNGVFYISKDGKNQEVVLEDLPSYFEGVKDLTISSDRNMKYQIIMDVMTKAKENKIENIGLTYHE